MNNQTILTVEEAEKLRGGDIRIPEGYARVESYAFYEREDLTAITVPGSVAVIEWCSFRNCNNLSHVYIENGVKEIIDCAFEFCVNLATVYIPKSIWHIGDNAFIGCIRLADIDVAPENTSYSSLDGVLFNKVRTVLIQYPVGDMRESYEIPKGVEKIEEGAFRTSAFDVTGFDEGGYIMKTRKYLEKVIIPDGIIEIPSDAFGNQSRLKCVNIPESVRHIREGAFQNCISLESLTIPDSIKDIEESAFEGCTNLSIRCREGSAAHKYAVENGIGFELICKVPDFQKL